MTMIAAATTVATYKSKEARFVEESLLEHSGSLCQPVQQWLDPCRLDSIFLPQGSAEAVWDILAANGSSRRHDGHGQLLLLW